MPEAEVRESPWEVRLDIMDGNRRRSAVASAAPEVMASSVWVTFRSDAMSQLA